MSNIGITLSADNRSMIRALQEADRALAGMSRDMTGALRQVEAQAKSTGQAMAGMGGANSMRGMRQATKDMNDLGMSAKATTAALRNVPAQFTDIVVSLQGGQAPLTVLLQQGGQLKDMFGGIGPAARALGGYVMGMVNPFTLLAAAAGVLALAYKQGSEEADAFRRALLLSGNAAGTSVDQLGGMAAAMDEAFGVTTGKAADALTAMAGTGRVARASLQDFAQVAVDMEKSFGQSIQDTAKNFADLGKDPLGASKRLNESLNFLTSSTYKQMQAAIYLGQTEKAAALAQESYAQAMRDRSKTVVENLGYIERAYRASLGWAKEAWDAILGVGRTETNAERMDKIRNELDLIDKGLRNVSERQKAGLRSQLEALQETERIAKLAGDRQAERAKIEKDGIAAIDQAVKDREKNKTQAEEKEKKRQRDAKEALEFAEKNARDSKRLHEDSLKSFASSLKAQQDRSAGLKSESDAIALSHSANVSLAVAVEMVNIAKLKERQIDAMGNEQAVLMIQKEIQERQKLIELTKNKEALSKSSSAFGAININQDATNVFGSQIAGALQFADAMKMVSRVQAESAEAYRANLAQNGQNLEEFGRRQQEIAIASAHSQIGAYASMASGLKSYAKEGSKTYKALEAVEKTFRLAQMALAIKSMVVEVTANKAKASTAAVAAVANQGTGDPYTAFPRIAAMIAIMAGLGLMAGKGGKGASFAPTNKGTGTVFGDSEAQSESIKNSIEYLNSIQDTALVYSRGMLQSLRNIENSMGGLTNLYLRSTGGAELAGSVPTGRSLTSLGKTLTFLNDPTKGALNFLPGVNFLNSVANKVIGSLFSKKVSITGRGITAGAQSLGSIFGAGFQGQNYVDIFTKKKTLGFTTSTSSGTSYSALDQTLEDQFTAIFRNIGESVTLASEVFGMDANEISKKLSNYVVSIGRIDLQGLSGAQIEERLTAVFGAQADNISRAIIPGFEQLQKVGEGYFQTLIRMAGQLELVSVWTERLGNRLSATGVSAAIFADDLIKVFGGQSEFNEAVGNFYKDFYTEEERTAQGVKELTAVFERLGLTLPDSLESYKQLVNAQDLTTEAGREMYAELLQIAPTFAEVAKKVQSSFKSIADSITNEINRIRGVVVGRDSRGFEYLQAQFAIMTAQARAGDQDAAKQLPEISRAMLELAGTNAKTLADLQRIQGLTATSLVETRAILAERFGLTIPAFADGGMHSGGLRLVGENGPELEATGASRIYNAQQTAALLGAGGDTASEVRGLREEMAMLRAEARAIATHTNKTAKILDRVTPDGNSLQITDVTVAPEATA